MLLYLHLHQLRVLQFQVWKDDYYLHIVTPQAHYLYVDGQLAKHEKYANNSHLSKLETVTLAIGEDANTTTKLSADIYNIKVYNRALNEQEIQYNYNTDKKRFNF